MHTASSIGLPYEIVCSADDVELWLAARLTGVGASEIAPVLGESPWKSAIALFAEKTGKAEPEDLADVEPVYWGRLLEDDIIAGYQDRTGRVVKRSGLMLRSTREYWATCTLDAETGENESDMWPLEVKAVGLAKAAEWEDGPPRHYYLQNQQQMLVTGARKSTSACLIGGQRLVWCDVERDEIEIRRIAHAGRVFWEQCVLAGIPPKPDGSASATAALVKLYPHAENATALLDAVMQDSFDRLIDVKAQLAKLEREEVAIENAFRAALGTASTGLLPSRAKVTWNQRRGGIDYKACALALGATPDMLEKYRREATRVFKLHEPKE